MQDAALRRERSDRAASKTESTAIPNPYLRRAFADTIQQFEYNELVAVGNDQLMSRFIAICISCVLILSGLNSASANETTGVKQTKLDTRIGPVKKDLTKRVSDAKDWQNPYIMIYDSGEVGVSWDSMKQSKGMKLSELKDFLIKLPVTAWPYGRIAGVQGCGITSGNKESQSNRKQSSDELTKILKDLHITLYPWPSA
jgi:hypothetical protein